MPSPGGGDSDIKERGTRRGLLVKKPGAFAVPNLVKPKKMWQEIKCCLEIVPCQATPIKQDPNLATS